VSTRLAAALFPLLITAGTGHAAHAQATSTAARSDTSSQPSVATRPSRASMPSTTRAGKRRLGRSSQAGAVRGGRGRRMPGRQRVQALQSGDLDLLSGDGLPFAAIDAVKQNAGLIYDQRPGLGWSGFMLNVARPPFSNKALAQAVQFAIDRDDPVGDAEAEHMRQAGIVAAAALYALDHHVERLADDHQRARRLAEGLAAAGLGVDVAPVETNFVGIEVEVPAADARSRSAEHGVLVGVLRPGVLRAATYLGIEDADLERAVDSIPRALGALVGA